MLKAWACKYPCVYPIYIILLNAKFLYFSLLNIFYRMLKGADGHLYYTDPGDNTTVVQGTNAPTVKPATLQKHA